MSWCNDDSHDLISDDLNIYKFLVCIWLQQPRVKRPGTNIHNIVSNSHFILLLKLEDFYIKGVL